jgi:hypothetical protein
MGRPVAILTRQLTVYRRSLELLRRQLTVEALLVAFTAVDAVGVVIVLQLAQAPAVGLADAGLAMAIALFGFWRRGSAAIRGPALAVLVLLLLALPQLVLISEQTVNSPLHDGILLTDAAGERLLAGLDPYGHDYLDSAARTFYLSDAPVNFGLRHYVYMPGMIILDLPIRALAAVTPRANFSWMFIPGLLALVVGAWTTGRTAASGMAAVVAVVLNPLFQLDYLYFLNDLFFMGPLLLAAGLLIRDRPGWSGIAFGVALSIKQQAVLLLPLALLYAALKWDGARWFRAALGAGAVLGAVVLPFLLWDPRAFLTDTAAFFYGSGVDSYPIRGLGLPGLLVGAGVIPNRWASYQATSLLQVFAAVLVLVAAVRDLRKNWAWPRFWAWNAVLAGVVFFFGRVLAPNYLDLIADFALLALASGLVGEAPVRSVVGDVDGAAGDGRVVREPAQDEPRDLVIREQGGA